MLTVVKRKSKHVYFVMVVAMLLLETQLSMSSIIHIFKRIRFV